MTAAASDAARTQADHEFELTIESLDLDGRGVAHRDGKVVFVDGALPGERVRVARRRSKARFETATTLAVLEASAQRVTPRCAHFGFERGACGGCAMQHIDAGAQVAIKQRALEDALWHLGRVRPDVVLAPVAGPAWHYRYRARLSVRFVARKGGVLVGFHERASSYVADMSTCAVLPARVSALLLPLRELVMSLSLRDRLPQIELAVGAPTQAGGAEIIVLVLRVLAEPTADDLAALREFRRQHVVSLWLQRAGPDSAQPLDDNTGDLALLLSEFGVQVPFGPTDFTQVNAGINQVLVSRAVRLLAPQPQDVVADFFCGLGNFTLPLATRARRVLGYEGATSLVQRAQAAAQHNGLHPRTRFVARNLFEWSDDDWHRANEGDGPISRVLLDPPREGALAIAQSLARTAQRPTRIVYVSCNPATLARDAAVLVHDGGWALRAAGVVNMFPHTAHVESLAVFEPHCERTSAEPGTGASS